MADGLPLTLGMAERRQRSLGYLLFQRRLLHQAEKLIIILDIESKNVFECQINNFLL